MQESSDAGEATVWRYERRFGIRFTRDEVSFFHRVTGIPRNRAVRQRGGWGRWALPLLATAGVAMAVPATRPPAIRQVSLALDAPVPTPHLPPPAPALTTLARPAPATATTTARLATPPPPRLAIPNSFFEEAAPGSGGATKQAALAAAISTGQTTDWSDPRTGEAGLVVVGDPDERGCRDVVVMTRRDDGRNDNAARRECD